MSAGVFELYFYETNGGLKSAIRLQPETIQAVLGGAVNASATGPATVGSPRVRVSASRRANGIHPRTVTVRFTTGTAPTGYAMGQTYTLPVLTETVWDGITDGAAMTYLGTTGTVVSKDSEKIK